MLIIISIIGAIASIFILAQSPTFNNFLIGTALGYSKEQRKMVLAQMQFETADFTSRAFKESNNVSGMRVATKRPQKGVKGKDSGGYAHFKCVYYSVLDLYKWLALNGIPKTNNAAIYCAGLKAKNYFEGGLAGYTSGVQKYYLIPKTMPIMTIIAIMLLLSCVVIFLYTLYKIIRKWLKK